MGTVGQSRDAGITFRLFVNCVNFPTVEVILTQVWTGGAEEEIRAWLPSAGLKSRQWHFLRDNKLKAPVFCQGMVGNVTTLNTGARDLKTDQT